MRKFIVLTAVLVGAMALPGTASATHGGTGCGYATAPPQTISQPVGPFTVYQGPGSSGNPTITAVGICMETNGTGGFWGGMIECGVGEDARTGETTDVSPGTGTDTYCVIDGDSRNTDPSGGSDGYIGMSSYESNTGPRNCGGPPPADGNGGTNGGGCMGIKEPPPGTGHETDPENTGKPTPICGDDTGEWDDSSRDGCSIPF